jgi:hypothetical protein
MESLSYYFSSWHLGLAVSYLLNDFNSANELQVQGIGNQAEFVQIIGHICKN